MRRRPGDQRADPAHVEIGAAVGAGEAFVDVGANRPVPVPAIGRVDGEFRRIGRDADALGDQPEFPRTPVEDEDIDARIECEHERGLRTVDDEARCTLRRAGLEEGREDVASLGRYIEKMVPLTEILFSRLSDPTSGSIPGTQSGARGNSEFRGSASSEELPPPGIHAARDASCHRRRHRYPSADRRRD